MCVEQFLHRAKEYVLETALKELSETLRDIEKEEGEERSLRAVMANVLDGENEDDTDGEDEGDNEKERLKESLLKRAWRRLASSRESGEVEGDCVGSRRDGARRWRGRRRRSRRYERQRKRVGDDDDDNNNK